MHLAFEDAGQEEEEEVEDRMMKLLIAGLPSTHNIFRWTASSPSLTIARKLSTSNAKSSGRISRSVFFNWKVCSSIPHSLRISHDDALFGRSYAWGSGSKVRELGSGGVGGAVAVRARAGEEVKDRVASFDAVGGEGRREGGRGSSSSGVGDGARDASFSGSRGRGGSWWGSRGRGRGGGVGRDRDTNSNSGSDFRAGSSRGRGRGSGGRGGRSVSSNGARQYSSSSKWASSSDRGRGRGGSFGNRLESKNGRDFSNGGRLDIEDGGWRPEQSSARNGNGESGASFRGRGRGGDERSEFSRGLDRGRGRGGRGSFGGSRGGRGASDFSKGEFRDSRDGGFSRGRGGGRGRGMRGRGSFGARGRGASSSFADRNSERNSRTRRTAFNPRGMSLGTEDDRGDSSTDGSPLNSRGYALDRNREREVVNGSPRTYNRDSNRGREFSRGRDISQRGGRGNFADTRGGRRPPDNSNGYFERDSGINGSYRGRGDRSRGRGLRGRGSVGRGRGSSSSFGDRDSGRDEIIRGRTNSRACAEEMEDAEGYSSCEDSSLKEPNPRSFALDIDEEQEVGSEFSSDSDTLRDRSISPMGGRSEVASIGERKAFGSREESPMKSQYVQRAVGEEKWQWMVRKKKNKSTSVQQFDDDEEFGGEEFHDEEFDDDMSGDENLNESEELEGGSSAGRGEVWRRRKIGWLCKEIPALRPSGIVTILNSQRKWIKSVDTKQVMEALMRAGDILRAHRVLKWTMQQPWYENDFELNTKMANLLGSNNKLTRMRDLFDTIIETGQPPDVSTYVILVKAYIADHESESLDDAFAIYNQMEQLGGYQQPAVLAFSLFKAFTDRQGGGHLRHLHQADDLFESIKKKGPTWTKNVTSDMWQAMYTALIHLHSVQGNGERVEELITEMKGAALDLHHDCYSALIRLCSKDGNVEKAEHTFENLIAAGHSPDWRTYVGLIGTYGTAGMPEKAWEVFDGMEAAGKHVNQKVVEALVEAMTKAGDKERAEVALEKAESEFASSIQDSYNLLMELYKNKEMFSEIETMFNRMKEKKCRPNHQAYNMVIYSFIKRGLLDKAEEKYEEMKDVGGIRPNLKTYSLMIEAFGEVGQQEKVKLAYEHLTERKLRVPDEVEQFVTEVVGKKKVAHQEKAKPRKLVQEQREMLVGVLLGGAKMASYDNNRTYEFQFELDSGSQAGPILINHLHTMLTEWAQQAPHLEVAENLEQNLGPKSLLRFATVSHGSFRFYAHQYRPEGKPIIPRLIHRWLNPQSLAYWYMYGGRKCEENGGIILNASHYTPKELTLVVKALKARTIDCVMKKRRSGNIICFKDKSAIWLWKLMEPHVLDELKDLLRPEERVGGDGGMINDWVDAFDGDSNAEHLLTENEDIESSRLGDSERKDLSHESVGANGIL